MEEAPELITLQVSTLCQDPLAVRMQRSTLARTLAGRIVDTTKHCKASVILHVVCLCNASQSDVVSHLKKLTPQAVTVLLGQITMSLCMFQD